jgi:prepilin-type N-terminal cleavage/methylation domain-containing protein
VKNTHTESGFSLIELLVATTVLLIVSSIVTTALMQMTNSQKTIWNRTEMHSGIRGATELLQQEVGQAGRIKLPGTLTLDAPVAATGGCDPINPTALGQTVGVTTSAAPVNAVAGLWATAGPPASYIMLTTLDGDTQETFRVGAIDAVTETITACFTQAHAAGTVLVPMGGFATGIIPNSGMVNPSSDTILKLYGDINGDGNMVYVEYTCDTTVGNLYRHVMPFDLLAASKPPLTDAHILLGNIKENPGTPPTPCFAYQTTLMTVQGTLFTFVLDVAITLTVETEQADPVTKQFQTETKALLNVSPRNVFNAWMQAGMGYTDRIQSTPVSVAALLAPGP